MVYIALKPPTKPVSTPGTRLWKNTWQKTVLRTQEKGQASITISLIEFNTGACYAHYNYRYRIKSLNEYTSAATRNKDRLTIIILASGKNPEFLNDITLFMLPALSFAALLPYLCII